MERINPNNLEKGDVFVEEGRSDERHEVVEFTTINGCAGVIGENIETGETEEFGGPLAFRGPLFLVEA